MLTPSATKHHAALAAVRRIPARQEECALFLDVIGNQEENARALVFTALILLVLATQYYQGDAQTVVLIHMMLTGLSSLNISCQVRPGRVVKAHLKEKSAEEAL